MPVTVVAMLIIVKNERTTRMSCGIHPYDRLLLNNKKECSADIQGNMDESQNN